MSDLRRDAAAERRLTFQVAEREWTSRVAAIRLVDFAEERAMPGPVRLTRDGAPRDFILEVREELADARNYLVWAIRSHTLDEKAEDRARVCLALVIDAWDALDA